MRWTGHVAHMEEMRNGYKFLVGKPERQELPQDLVVIQRVHTGLLWLRSGTDCGLL
jgi:hypothetical protein